jgi:hypothetical protein
MLTALFIVFTVLGGWRSVSWISRRIRLRQERGEELGAGIGVRHAVAPRGQRRAVAARSPPLDVQNPQLATTRNH